MEVLTLPCGCEIKAQYLPLNGGERQVGCVHDRYVIKATRKVTTTFKIWSERTLEDLGEGFTE